MSAKVILHQQAEKDLKKLPKNVLKATWRALELLEENPLAGLPLRGELEGKRKYRVGDWRIIYQFLTKEKTIIIFKIESRGQVYKK
ncbi:type II toxin-antitoxin system RelE/ParE family toxin [Candidatus Gottesmanbacteria bacterium]|nr:type II toxin-antitoxin system RelE/ParE family toxin [Candidatus Gottesmanbacteria bacterium]